ncbi:hypothetical protein [Nocardia sp. NPDC056000]|uniref:hypothetical protein n=1 Tax=Nocardia sp. NPDC056000 TaxID=3345674 RepID=UPI0035D6D7C6
MWTEAADLEILMERLAEAGVSMLLRVDARTLGQCVSRGLRRLRDQHESWDWLDDWV